MSRVPFSTSYQADTCVCAVITIGFTSSTCGSVNIGIPFYDSMEALSASTLHEKGRTYLFHKGCNFG
jgi:hypothetical protein